MIAVGDRVKVDPAMVPRGRNWRLWFRRMLAETPVFVVERFDRTPEEGRVACLKGDRSFLVRVDPSWLVEVDS